MQSKISDAIALKHSPVALIWTGEKPQKSVMFKKGKWGCIMWLVASAAKGRTSACDRETFGCPGGGVGVGFGNQYKNFPGGEACFHYFLSTGNDSWEEGKQAAERLKPYMREEAFDDFTRGERYVQTPEKVKKFIDCLPITDIPAEYVIFKPLGEVDKEKETPRSITFFVNPDQLSALIVLANYGRGDNENVFIPFAAGCQSIGVYPYKEADAEKGRAVVGLTDISARVHIRQQLGDNLMTFTTPMSLFDEMEENVEGSFLQRPTWQTLLKESVKL